MGYDYDDGYGYGYCQFFVMQIVVLLFYDMVMWIVILLLLEVIVNFLVLEFELVDENVMVVLYIGFFVVFGFDDMLSMWFMESECSVYDFFSLVE